MGASSIVGLWSLIKRGVVGTYHKVRKKYLPLYVTEFEFRYNNRENADIFGAAIAGCWGPVTGIRLRLQSSDAKALIRHRRRS
jgi:ISXO2-like transposase domain